MHNFLAALKKLVEEQSERIEVARGEWLIRPGQVEKHLYWIEQGAFHAFSQREEENVTFRLAYSGNFITALPSFISGKPSELYWACLRKSVVHRLPKSVFVSLCEEQPQGYITFLEQMLLQEMEREIDLLLTKPAERFERLLQRSPRVLQEVPAKYVAAYLRMTPETLSRLQKY